MNSNFKELFDDNPDCRKTKVTFRMLGNNLMPAEITRHIGLKPSRAYAKGEAFTIEKVGVRHRSIGHWSISSEGQIHSTSTEAHAKFILQLLEPKADDIGKFLQEPDIRTSIIVWWEADGEHGSFSISSDTLGKLSRLCNNFEYHFLGFMDKEA